MNPIAFTIGALQIRWYGIAMAVSMLIGAYIASRLLKRWGRNGDLVWDGLFWIILAGIIGARLAYVVTNPSAYFGSAAKWWYVFAVWQGGLSFHGGIICGMLATYFYFRNKGIPFVEIMDAFGPGVSLGVILVRIGNFMNGDILGYKWNGPWALNFPHDELHLAQAGAIIPRHPTEIYGMVVGLFCLVVSIILLNETYTTKRFAPGATFMGFILTYSLVRSVIEEPFRDVPLIWKVTDPQQAGIGLFTATQIASVFLVLLALWGFTQLRKWERRRAEAALAPPAALAPRPAPSTAGGPTRQARRAAERAAEKRDKK